MKKFLVESEEQKLKEKRRELSCNVIIKGLAEEGDEDDDSTLAKVTALLQEVVPDAEVEEAFRLGRRKDTAARVVKVVLDSKDTRNKILTSVKKHSKEANFKNIYVNADRPLADRQEAYRLRQKMKGLKEQHPNRSIYLRSGKLYMEDTVIDREQPLQNLFHSS